MNRSARRQLFIAIYLVLLLGAWSASAGADLSLDPLPDGAAAMFLQGDRLFAIGAESGGAGFGVQPDAGENLPPSPGGEVYENSRCAMQSGTCGGTCVAHIGYYCSTGTCNKFDFCP